MTRPVHSAAAYYALLVLLPASLGPVFADSRFALCAALLQAWELKYYRTALSTAAHSSGA